jgi:hypothetical protein
MTGITTLMRRLVGAVAVVAVAGVLVAPAQAKAAFTIGGSPTGAVTNAQNGNIFYYIHGETPHVAGWAADTDAGLGPISVTAAVTWYRTTCFTFCWSRVVGQTSLTQTANLWESATLGTIWGPNHGFWFDLPTLFGQYDREVVCVTAVNVGYGSDTSLGCYDVVGYDVN